MIPPDLNLLKRLPDDQLAQTERLNVAFSEAIESETPRPTNAVVLSALCMQLAEVLTLDDVGPDRAVTLRTLGSLLGECLAVCDYTKWKKDQREHDAKH